MADTNILVSAALFRDGSVAAMLKEIMSRYDLCICTFSLEELFIVFERKFKHKRGNLDEFLRELSYDLVYSTLKIEKRGFRSFGMRKTIPSSRSQLTPTSTCL